MQCFVFFWVVTLYLPEHVRPQLKRSNGTSHAQGENGKFSSGKGQYVRGADTIILDIFKATPRQKGEEGRSKSRLTHAGNGFRKKIPGRRKDSNALAEAHFDPVFLFPPAVSETSLENAFPKTTFSDRMLLQILKSKAQKTHPFVVKNFATRSEDVSFRGKSMLLRRKIAISVDFLNTKRRRKKLSPIHIEPDNVSQGSHKISQENAPPRSVKVRLTDQSVPKSVPTSSEPTAGNEHTLLGKPSHKTMSERASHHTAEPTDFKETTFKTVYTTKSGLQTTYQNKPSSLNVSASHTTPDTPHPMIWVPNKKTKPNRKDGAINTNTNARDNASTQPIFQTRQKPRKQVRRRHAHRRVWKEARNTFDSRVGQTPHLDDLHDHVISDTASPRARASRTRKLSGSTTGQQPPPSPGRTKRDTSHHLPLKKTARHGAKNQDSATVSRSTKLRNRERRALISMEDTFKAIYNENEDPDISAHDVFLDDLLTRTPDWNPAKRRVRESKQFPQRASFIQQKDPLNFMVVPPDPTSILSSSSSSVPFGDSRPHHRKKDLSRSHQPRQALPNDIQTGQPDVAPPPPPRRHHADQADQEGPQKAVKSSSSIHNPKRSTDIFPEDIQMRSAADLEDKVFDDIIYDTRIYPEELVMDYRIPYQTGLRRKRGTDDDDDDGGGGDQTDSLDGISEFNIDDIDKVIQDVKFDDDDNNDDDDSDDDDTGNEQVRMVKRSPARAAKKKPSRRPPKRGPPRNSNSGSGKDILNKSLAKLDKGEKKENTPQDQFFDAVESLADDCLDEDDQKADNGDDDDDYYKNVLDDYDQTFNSKEVPDKSADNEDSYFWQTDGKKERNNNKKKTQPQRSNKDDDGDDDYDNDGGGGGGGGRFKSLSEISQSPVLASTGIETRSKTIPGYKDDRSSNGAENTGMPRASSVISGMLIDAHQEDAVAKAI